MHMTKGDTIQQHKKMTVSNNEATEMIETTNKIFAEDTTKTERLQPSVFAKLFEPSFQ